jgi:hypothetical protein
MVGLTSNHGSEPKQIEETKVDQFRRKSTCSFGIVLVQRVGREWERFPRTWEARVSESFTDQAVNHLFTTPTYIIHNFRQLASSEILSH